MTETPRPSEAALSLVRAARRQRDSTCIVSFVYREAEMALEIDRFVENRIKDAAQALLDFRRSVP